MKKEREGGLILWMGGDAQVYHWPEANPSWQTSPDQAQVQEWVGAGEGDGNQAQFSLLSRISLDLRSHPQSSRGGMASGPMELEPKTIEPSISGSQPLLKDLPGTAEKIELIVPQGSKE